MMDILGIALAGIIGLAALLLAGHFASRAWSGWLDLKKLELANGRPQADEPVAAGGADRIELADLRARIRKLEAIASGIDL
jgi:hypothetical protein